MGANPAADQPTEYATDQRARNHKAEQRIRGIGLGGVGQISKSGIDEISLQTAYRAVDYGRVISKEQSPQRGDEGQQNDVRIQSRHGIPRKNVWTDSGLCRSLFAHAQLPGDKRHSPAAPVWWNILRRLLRQRWFRLQALPMADRPISRPFSGMNLPDGPSPDSANPNHCNDNPLNSSSDGSCQATGLSNGGLAARLSIVPQRNGCAGSRY